MKKSNVKRSKHNANRLKARRHRIAKSAQAPAPTYRLMERSAYPGRRRGLLDLDESGYESAKPRERAFRPMSMGFPLAMHAAAMVADDLKLFKQKEDKRPPTHREIVAMAAMSGAAMLLGKKKED